MYRHLMLSSKKQMQHVFGANTLSPKQPFLTTRDTSFIALRITTPIPDHLLYVWPFLDYSLDQIFDFAIAELNGSDLSPTNLIILDERTNDDQTCLLLSKNEVNEETMEYVQVRSDFESAVVVLKTVETGCGDAEGQLSTRYSGSDGVLRISVRDR